MFALYDIPAPAKLNLFLHITGRRADGYHLLQSVFMLIDWQDRLHFERTNCSTISRTDSNPEAAVLPQQDLCVRAALALQRATRCQYGVHITIDKQIPAQAGMGGGSSDAATTLIALNRLWNLGLRRNELECIGLTLGADVPFFLRGHNAWVEGIGEIITPLQGVYQLPPAEFVVIKPATGLDTRQIFSSPALKRDSKLTTIEVFAKNCYDFGCNDLQSVAEMQCTDVKKARIFLETQGMRTTMTGSGSAVFAKLAQSVDLKDAPRDWIIKVCRNLRIHPLYSWVPD